MGQKILDRLECTRSQQTQTDTKEEARELTDPEVNWMRWVIRMKRDSMRRD